MNTVSIPADLANALHDYLMSRPMREVEGLVLSLRKAEPVTPPEMKPAPRKRPSKP